MTGCLLLDFEDYWLGHYLTTLVGFDAQPLASTEQHSLQFRPRQIFHSGLSMPQGIVENLVPVRLQAPKMKALTEGNTFSHFKSFPECDSAYSCPQSARLYFSRWYSHSSSQSFSGHFSLASYLCPVLYNQVLSIWLPCCGPGFV